MPLIVDIRDRIATGNRERIVCGNSDYIINFNFDAEWDNYPTKTAVFKWGKNFEMVRRVPFEGNECNVPSMFDTTGFKVGVIAGDLRCTTAAFFGADPCALCNVQEEAPPSEDIYNEIMDLINKKAGGDPALIRKVFMDTVNNGELIYNWCVIPNRYIFSDVMVTSGSINVYPDQIPTYEEPLFVEIEGVVYNAVWESETTISNEDRSAIITINSDETITITSDIEGCVVSLYKVSDISPIIIPRDHLPKEEDPTVETWAKLNNSEKIPAEKIKVEDWAISDIPEDSEIFLFNNVELTDGNTITTTPNFSINYGDYLLIDTRYSSINLLTWTSETTLEEPEKGIRITLNNDGTVSMTSTVIDGVTDGSWSSVYVYRGDAYKDKHIIPMYEMDPNVQDWAKLDNSSPLVEIYAPYLNDYNMALHSVMEYNSLPSEGSTYVIECIGVKTGAIERYNVTYTLDGWEFSNDDEKWAFYDQYYFSSYEDFDAYEGYVIFGNNQWWREEDVLFRIFEKNSSKLLPTEIIPDIPKEKLPVETWAMKGDPYILKDVTGSQTITPYKMPIRKEGIGDYSDSDIVIEFPELNRVGKLMWENDTRLFYGLMDWNYGPSYYIIFNLNEDDNTIEIKINRNEYKYTPFSVYQEYGSSTGLIPRDKVHAEMDIVTETWAKEEDFISVTIPNNETTVTINPKYFPSVGSFFQIDWFHINAGSQSTTAYVVDNNGLPAIYGLGCSVEWTDEFTAIVTSELPGASGTTRVDVLNASKIPNKRLPIATEESVGVVKAVSATSDMIQPVGVTSSGQLKVKPYSLPIATADTIGGVQPVAVTDDMTQPVGVDSSGALFTTPGGGGELKLIAKVTTEANAQSIGIEGIDSSASVLSLRVYNIGSNCGGGVYLTLNGTKVMGYVGTQDGSDTTAAKVRGWIIRTDDGAFARFVMSNTGINLLTFNGFTDNINSIVIGSYYNDSDDTKYYQAGTVFEVWEGVYPNVQ